MPNLLKTFKESQHSEDANKKKNKYDLKGHPRSYATFMPKSF